MAPYGSQLPVWPHVLGHMETVAPVLSSSWIQHASAGLHPCCIFTRSTYASPSKTCEALTPTVLSAVPADVRMPAVLTALSPTMPQT